MNEKNKRSLLGLLGNKVFVLLLAVAVGIITVSVMFGGPDTQREKTASVEKLEEVAPVVKTEEPKKTEKVQAETMETIPVPDPVEVKYTMPMEGIVQRTFALDELVWDETMEDWRTHTAVDIASDEGDEVHTAGKGIVTIAKNDGMYGNMVQVEHGDGVVTVYKNLGKIVVEEGDVLDEGQMVGTVGKDAAFENAQKPHLHFEVIKDGIYVDPMDFIK